LAKTINLAEEWYNIKEFSLFFWRKQFMECQKEKFLSTLKFKLC